MVRWDDLLSESLEYDPAGEGKLALPTGGGVYLLTDGQDRLVQLASAADLKRAIAHRLAPPAAQTPTGESHEASLEAVPTVEATVSEEAVRSEPAAPARRRADLSQIVRRIRWQPAHSAFEIAYEYLRIARVVQPETYQKNLAFGPAWFVHVDPDAEVPRFLVAKRLSAASGTSLGPFATQQDANRFVQVLEDVFDLCRHTHILEQVPHGQPCAYHEMGRCPAPCGGLTPMSQYRSTVQAATRFAAGEREGTRLEWEQQMRQAAGELAFERAASLKQRLERAKELDHTAYRLVRPVERFSWLIVQRGRGRTRIKPFFVRGGRLQPGEVTGLKDLDHAVASWMERLRADVSDRQPDQDDPQVRSESIWLVSHFLFRRDPPGLFFEASRLPETHALVQSILEHFAITRPEPSSPGELTPERADRLREGQ